ncbi:MAG: thiamine phosphate synthase [Hyphomicrobiales bacterium]
MSLPKCRLFLVAPSDGDAAAAAKCLEAAVAAGDVASILLSAGGPGASKGMIETLLPLAQRLGVAAIVAGHAGLARGLRADGVELSAGSDAAAVADARGTLMPGAIVGADAGASRHAAMELAEAGADYVVLSGELDGEPLAAWWADVSTVPAVAGGAVAPEAAHALAERGVEFVRAAGDWSSPEAMRAALSAYGTTESAA